MQVFVGNLGKDPELKFSSNGLAVAKFSLAVTERVKQGNDWVDGSTTWYTVTSFRALAEGVTESLRKGDRVVVAGVVKERSFERGDGTTGTALEVEASEVGKALSRFKGFSRTSATTGLSTLKDTIAETFPNAVVQDDAPPF